MSIYWMTQVWENSKVSKSGHLLTFLAIADNANKAGIAWPGVETISKMSRLSERHTSRIIGDLEKTGELYTHRQTGKVNFYFIYINREKEEAKKVLQEWFKFSPEQSEHTIQVLDNLLNRTPDNLSPPTQMSGTPDIAMSSDPLLSLLYNKGLDQDIRSGDNYKLLQNVIVEVCKKLNILALKEKDVENIDVLFASDVTPAEVRKYYSPNGRKSWWYTQYWKGKKGQFPTTQDIIDTLEQARAGGEGGNDSTVALQEVQEWIQGERQFSDFSSPVTAQVIREMGEYELKNRNPQWWAIRFKETFDKYNPDLQG